MIESNRSEYKRELTDSLEREAVAFLNAKEGGVIYVGLDDQGEPFKFDLKSFVVIGWGYCLSRKLLKNEVL